MIEIPAGRVGPQETAHQAAARECYEEIGVYPLVLRPLFEVMPAPALSDECMMLYVALIDATDAKAHAGCKEEQEYIEPIRVSIDAAIGTLLRGGIHNGTAIIALQWLTINRDALGTIFDKRMA
jgi:ADP-ribose pyrophosphatase